MRDKLLWSLAFVVFAIAAIVLWCITGVVFVYGLVTEGASRLKRMLWGLWMVMFALIVAHVLLTPAKADELTDAVNVERAKHGLHPLAHDKTLATWARFNNYSQRQFGIGHHVFIGSGAARQNAAVGQRSIAEVVAAWMASPAHRLAMLDPGLTTAGGEHGDGDTWTINFSYATQLKSIESKPVAPLVAQASAQCVIPAAQACQSPAPCLEFARWPIPQSVRARRGGLFRNLLWRVQINLQLGNY